MVIEKGHEACALYLEAFKETIVVYIRYGQLIQALVDTEGDMDVLAFLD